MKEYRDWHKSEMVSQNLTKNIAIDSFVITSETHEVGCTLLTYPGVRGVTYRVHLGPGFRSKSPDLKLDPFNNLSTDCPFFSSFFHFIFQ